MTTVEGHSFGTVGAVIVGAGKGSRMDGLGQDFHTRRRDSANCLLPQNVRHAADC